MILDRYGTIIFGVHSISSFYREGENHKISFSRRTDIDV